MKRGKKEVKKDKATPEAPAQAAAPVEAVPADPRRMQRLHLALLALVCAMAFYLRFHKLGSCLLWIDEITLTWFSGLDLTPAKIIGHIYSSFLKQGATGEHMPFQYVLLNSVRHVYDAFGFQPNELLYRLPFALFGALTIPIVYLFARARLGPRLGLWAAALAALSFFHVYQSRDATGYGPLLFFAALNLYGLALVFEDAELPSRALIRRGLVLFAGTFGMVFTHLSAWLVLIAEMAALGALAAASALRGRRSPGSASLVTTRAVLAMVIVGAACLPCVKFPLALATSGDSPLVSGYGEPVTLDILVYQIAHLGWGKGYGRLPAFLAAVAAGAIALSRERKRVDAAFLGALVLIPAILFFATTKRAIFPRYLAVTFLPLTILAAAGVDGILRLITSTAPERRRAYLIGVVAACAILAGWHAAPFRALFAMRDKLMPMSYVREWLEKNTDPGTLCVWQNGYYLRDIGNFYPVPGRQVAYAGFSNAEKPPEALAQRSRLAKSLFERLPHSVLIFDTTDTEFDEKVWSWLKTDFAKRDTVPSDNVLDRLWRWGLSPHGVKTPEHSASFDVFHNGADDILHRVDKTGADAAWPEGGGWQFAQVQDGRVFSVVRGRAAVTVYRPSGVTGPRRLVAQGAAVEDGELQSLGPAGQPLATARFTKGQSGEFDLGVIDPPRGLSSVMLSEKSDDRPRLLIYSFALRAPEEAAPAAER